MSGIRAGGLQHPPRPELGSPRQAGSAVAVGHRRPGCHQDPVPGPAVGVSGAGYVPRREGAGGTSSACPHRALRRATRLHGGKGK